MFSICNHLNYTKNALLKSGDQRWNRRCLHYLETSGQGQEAGLMESAHSNLEYYNEQRGGMLN